MDNKFLKNLKVEDNEDISYKEIVLDKIIHNVIKNRESPYSISEISLLTDEEILELVYVLFDESEDLYKRIKNKELYNRRTLGIIILLDHYRDKYSEEYQLASILCFLKDLEVGVDVEWNEYQEPVKLEIFDISDSPLQLREIPLLSKENMQKITPAFFEFLDKHYSSVSNYLGSYIEIAESFKELKKYYEKEKLHNLFEFMHNISFSIYWLFQVVYAYKRRDSVNILFALKELEKAFLKDIYENNKEHIYALYLIYKKIANYCKRFNKTEAYVYFNKAYDLLCYLRNFFSIEGDLELLKKEIDELRNEISKSELLDYDNSSKIEAKTDKETIRNFLKEAQENIVSNPELSKYYIDRAKDIALEIKDDYLTLYEIQYLYYLIEKNRDSKNIKIDRFLKIYDYLYSINLEETDLDIYDYLKLFSEILKEGFRIGLSEEIIRSYEDSFKKLEEYSKKVLLDYFDDIEVLKLVIDNLFFINNDFRLIGKLITREEIERYNAIEKLWTEIINLDSKLENIIGQFEILSYIGQAYYKKGLEMNTYRRASSYFRKSSEIYNFIKRSFSKKEIQEALTNISDHYNKNNIINLEYDYLNNLYLKKDCSDIIKTLPSIKRDINIKIIKLQEELLSQEDILYDEKIWSILNEVLESPVGTLEKPEEWAAEKYYKFYKTTKPNLDDSLNTSTLYLYKALNILLDKQFSLFDDGFITDSKLLEEYKDTLLDIINLLENLSNKWFEKKEIEKEKIKYIDIVLDSLYLLRNYYAFLKEDKKEKEIIFYIEEIINKLMKIEDLDYSLEERIKELENYKK